MSASPPNNPPTTTLYPSTSPAISRLSLLKLLSTIPTTVVLVVLTYLRYRLRQALVHITIHHAHSHLPSFLLDLFLWSPLFYIVLIIQLAVFYLSAATIERLVALPSPEDEARVQARWAERRRKHEDERTRRERVERRQALLVGGGGGWASRAERPPVRVRWGKDVNEETKVAWWEQRVVPARKEEEEGMMLERAGLGQAVRFFT